MDKTLTIRRGLDALALQVNAATCLRCSTAIPANRGPFESQTRLSTLKAGTRNRFCILVAFAEKGDGANLQTVEQEAAAIVQSLGEEDAGILKDVQDVLEVSEFCQLIFPRNN